MTSSLSGKYFMTQQLAGYVFAIAVTYLLAVRAARALSWSCF